MFANALLAVAPVLGLAAYCVSHVAACRTIRGRGDYYPLMLGCLCGMAATAAVSIAALTAMHASLADGLALCGMNLLAYLAFSFGYFNFINLNIASLRIRMLDELAASGGRMPAAELAKLYDTNAVIAVRIDRLVSGGHLIERRGRYLSGKRKFLIVGRIFDFLRWMILGGQSPPAAARADQTKTFE